MDFLEVLIEDQSLGHYADDRERLSVEYHGPANDGRVRPELPGLFHNHAGAPTEASAI